MAICDLARDSDAGRALLAISKPQVGAAKVFGLLDNETLVPVAVRWFVAQPSEDVKERVYSLVEFDKASAKPPQLHTALLAVALRPAMFTVAEQRALLNRCLTLGTQPIDPYSPEVLSFASRNAAAALLQRNPALDPTFVEHLRGAGDARADLVAVLAAALQVRPTERTEAIVATVKVWRPKPSDLLEFATQCDQRYSAVDPILPPLTKVVRWWNTGWARLAVPAATMRRLGELVLAAAAGPLAAAAAVAIHHLIGGTPPDLALSSGEILGALGILVAVHVIASQLAADRLAGLVARFTSTPPSLLAGYSAGITLLVASVVHYPDEEAMRLAIQIGVTAALVVFVLATMLTLVRRTDPVVAVRAFVRARGAASGRAGRRLGTVHRRALRGRELIAGLGWATLTLAAPRVLRRVQINAPRRGFLVVSLRRLERLQRRDPWPSERVRLQFPAPLGTEVQRGDEVISVVPAEDWTLSRAEVREASRLARVRRLSGVDASNESAGLLVNIVVQLAIGGNAAGAADVVERLSHLIDVHLTAVRQARRPELEDKTALSVPILRTVVVQALHQLRDSNDTTSEQALKELLQKVAALTDSGDAFAALVGINARSILLPARRFDTALSLLWNAGGWAIEVDDALGLTAVRDCIERCREPAGDLMADALEAGARLAQLAAWVRYEEARSVYRWFEGLSPVDARRKVRCQVRIGASGLMAGHFSLATEVALDLEGTDFTAWGQYFRQPEVADSERLLSQLYHHLLGEDPEAALQKFLDYARDVDAAVS